LSDGKKENQMTTVLEFLSTISTLVPVIKEMMTSIEAEMGAGTGADKKAAVISGIQGIVGDSSNWAHLQTILSVIIDFLAKKYFGSKV
jgi:mannose/fructose/N-acetylgalactosamine-specific phosphotransferase system component IID